ncbi:DUF550 domain-containing protein [Salmonella enterica subsp. enterica]|nr:DUF550 domain-containing protein [Salmonella enterica]EBX3086641.1 DUF550 domain-containing protein [Salmonella enterica subsp. enterica serovar Weltevreden]EDV3444034.1 DUF550 domain-containing protein [Salmonella enterica subsp. enterica]EBZ8882711.1 DUF550 domain-containing protein [Salmonella enterica subsp. enterica serovar Weltevreden]ECP4274858.1 DUF550 domain-containing protein [Salmonella enterica]
MTTITSKFTKERLIDWAVVAVAERGRDLKDAPESVEAAANLKLAEIALAALTAEPVAYNQVQRDMMKDIIVRKMGGNLAGEKLVMDDIHAVTMALIDAGFRTAPPVQETGVYKDMLNIIGLLEKNEWAEHCTNTVLGSLLESEITRLVSKEQQAPERERIRRKHAEWSDKTFGDVGPVGPLKHLSKEALEAAADPSDPLEWADMQFLLWDAQRRMGISDEFITRAMIEKLEINKSRQWPEPKDGEPRLHIKEQPAPVVPPAIEPDYEVIKGILPTTNPDEYACCIAADMWNACRAAMLQGSQPVSNRDELQVIGWLRSDYNSDDKRDPNAPLFMLGSNDPSETWGVKYIPLSGSSPAIPDGWISCSERMPDDDESKPIAIFTGKCLGQGMFVATYDDDGFFDYWEGMEIIGVSHWMPLPAAPQQE